MVLSLVAIVVGAAYAFLWVLTLFEIARTRTGHPTLSGPAWFLAVLLVPLVGVAAYQVWGAPPTARDGGARVPPYRDVRVIRVYVQVVAVATAVVVGLTLYDNLTGNLEAQGIETGFGFLNNPTQFTVAANPFSPSQPLWQLFFVGIKNTFLVAFFGIILATVVGVLVGVARLSSNWLIVKAATVYVETIRNIPPVLVIIFVSTAFILQPLPVIQDAWEPLGLFVVSNRAMAGPSFIAESNSGPYLIVLAVALVLAVATWIWRTRVFNLTGAPHHRVLWSSGVLLGIAGIAYAVLGGPYSVSTPSVVGGLEIEGGFGMLAAYAALTLALGLYTASHIAEVIRGSIQAVPKGQTEASRAVALSEYQRMRFVVLPLAMRIAIPPYINQCLNLTKNSSLGIAIAFAEITLLTRTAIGNANPAPQLILILMMIYLSFSLITSLLLNVVNRRFQLVEN